MIEEFEHGIDHCGHGVAPLLVIGGPVYPSNFEVRDLSSIQGVVVKERGQSKGLNWADLNLHILGERLKNLRSLNIEFSGKVNLDDFGVQINLTSLYLNCPQMLAPSRPLFPALLEADILAPDKALPNLLTSSLGVLHLHRPKFSDLAMLFECRSLRALHIYSARNLTSINGLPNSLHMEMLGFHDCPALDHIHPQQPMSGPTEILIGGCKRFENLYGAELFSKLRKISLLGPGPEVAIPEALKAASIQLEIQGRKVAPISPAH